MKNFWFLNYRKFSAVFFSAMWFFLNSRNFENHISQYKEHSNLWFLAIHEGTSAVDFITEWNLQNEFHFVEENEFGKRKNCKKLKPRTKYLNGIDLKMIQERDVPNAKNDAILRHLEVFFEFDTNFCKIVEIFFFSIFSKNFKTFSRWNNLSTVWCIFFKFFSWMFFF